MDSTNLENGNKLKGFRIQNKLTVKEVAKLCNISERMIKYWECGQYAMPKRVIDKLNKEYNLCLKWKTKGGTTVSTVTYIPKEISVSSPQESNLTDKEAINIKNQLLQTQKTLMELSLSINSILEMV